jgi:hypothetical protein
MNPIVILPAGIRLDAWPTMQPAKAPEDSPEVAELRRELRKAMPEMTAIFDMFSKLQPLRDLAGRLAGPQPAQTKIHRT